MKPVRLFLKSSSIALLCMLSFSCVDEAYDISKVKDITLLKNVDLPIGTFETSMDSILKTVDLKVKNGVYTFLVGNAIDLSAVNSALSGFTPALIPNPAATVVDMLDGTSLPHVPSNVPVGSTDYAGSTSVTLPSFKTTMIDPVDSILLSNTTFTMKAITNNLGGSGLNSSISITCSPVGNAAEYYDPSTGNKITSWNIPVNNTSGKTIGIRILKPANGSNLQINCAAALNVVDGSPVTITAKAMTSISLTVAFSPVDFQTVYGKVDYGKSDNVDIDFGGFGDIITNNSVISFYDPTLKLYSNSNLGIPINLTLNMSSKNSVTNISSNPVIANRTILAASNPTSTKQNVLTINEPNDGLAGLFKVNPDQISMGYTIQTNKTISSFVNKNTFLTLSDTMEIPLRFANDLVLNKQIEMESPFKKLMDSLPTQDSLQIGFVLTVTNRIPLAIRIKMIGLDDNGDEQFTVTSGLIRAGDAIDSNGFATDTAITTTELLFDNTQINLLKSTPKFKVEFAISATQASGGAALRPSDFIKIKVAGKIRGGFTIDLGDNTSN